MKKILILGSGAGGTMVANQLRKKLDANQWDISIIDNDEVHHYQPGWLFIPFDVYSAEDCKKPKREFIPEGVNFILDEIVGIDKDNRKVEGKKAKYDYDWLVIGTGCTIVPEEVEGMMDDWRNGIHDFYTLEGAIALRDKMKYFNKGRVILNIAELPYKCPVAPIEFVFMADWFFKENGCRDDVEIDLPVLLLPALGSSRGTTRPAQRHSVYDRRPIQFPIGDFGSAKRKERQKKITQ